jgi:alpha-galactosidase
VLDVTHPAAEAYIRGVFRKWSQDWGCGYFKTDFMHLGSRYGPETARWHQDGLSRMEIWMRMARLIREEIGEALWLACGSPIWAPVGLVDAVRIGRDIGVSWKGQQQSAESLLRDQTARNFAHGILWQADPDCILLRERFHELSDEQVRSLAIFAGLAGGVLMTSDHFGEMPPERRELFRYLAGDGASFACDYPMLGRASMRHEVGPAPEGRLKVVTEADPVVVQRVSRPAGVLLNVFNTGDLPVERLLPWALAGGAGECPVTEDGAAVAAANAGLYVTIAPHRSRQFLFARQ